MQLLPIPPPRVDSSKGPHRVNRAHGPTKGNTQFFCILFEPWATFWIPRQFFSGVMGYFVLDPRQFFQESFVSFFDP